MAYPKTIEEAFATLLTWPDSYEEVVVPQARAWMRGVLARDEDCDKYVDACIWENCVSCSGEVKLGCERYRNHHVNSVFRNSHEATAFEYKFRDLYES